MKIQLFLAKGDPDYLGQVYEEDRYILLDDDGMDAVGSHLSYAEAVRMMRNQFNKNKHYARLIAWLGECKGMVGGLGMGEEGAHCSMSKLAECCLLAEELDQSLFIKVRKIYDYFDGFSHTIMTRDDMTIADTYLYELIDDVIGYIKN